jgi:predicted MFS family arabinose efflux permease
MARFGRAWGLAIGAGFAVASGVLGHAAIMTGSFGLFCLAGVLYGVFAAFAQYLRFAAVDAADLSCCGAGVPLLEPGRARAVGVVMAGGILAALVGPELARQSSDWFAPLLFAGSQLAIAAVALLFALALLFLRLPAEGLPPRVETDRIAGRLWRDPAILTAFGTALVAYLSMNLLMTAAPLAMLGCGFGMADSSVAIQWHVLGMFLPSLVSGYLIARIGAGPVILAGAGLLLACVAAHLAGSSIGHFALGLALLGAGWNLMFVGATVLLADAIRPHEKARVQGIHDLALSAGVAGSALLAGALQETVGWTLLNLMTIPGLVLVIVLMMRRLRPLRGAPA